MSNFKNIRPIELLNELMDIRHFLRYRIGRYDSVRVSSLNFYFY